MKIFILSVMFLFFVTTYGCATKCVKKEVKSAIARGVEECPGHLCSPEKKAELAMQASWDVLSNQMDWSWLHSLRMEEDERQRRIEVILREERERIAAGRGKERIIPGTSAAEDRIQRFWILVKKENEKKKRI